MSERRGINSNDVKNRNRGLVLRLICSKSPVARIEIAKLTGLSKMTVTNIISELMESGYVIETNVAESGSVGRNRIELDISPRAPKIIGLYLSRTGISSVLVDLKLGILSEYSETLKNETADTIKAKLIEATNKVLTSLGSTDRVLGIGVAALGPLDIEKGTILNPPDFFGIRNIAVVRTLQEEFSLPVILNNDMNAAALAEHLFGDTGGSSDFLYLGISDGVGAGIISGGSLFHNNSGLVGELGHMSINFEGAVCHCGGRGCLELYVTLPKLLKELCAVENRVIIAEDFEGLSDNPHYLSIFERVTGYLATALISAVNILSPDCIIIGHEGVYLPKSQLKLLEKTINRKILAAGHIKVKVFPSSFGSRSPLFGSGSLVLKELFDGKML